MIQRNIVNPPRKPGIDPEAWEGLTWGMAFSFLFWMVALILVITFWPGEATPLAVG
jgi:hypothetical protein